MMTTRRAILLLVKHLLAWIAEVLGEPAHQQPTQQPSDRAGEFLYPMPDEEPPDEELDEALQVGAEADLALLLTVTFSMPERLPLEDLVALCILDPERAEQIRWTLLARMGIRRTGSLSALDAWLEHTREISGNPYITLELLNDVVQNVEGRRWLTFLQGVEMP